MVLAHGSGIDDILMFAIPVVVALFALRVAEKRAKTRLDAQRTDPKGTEPTV